MKKNHSMKAKRAAKKYINGDTTYELALKEANISNILFRKIIKDEYPNLFKAIEEKRAEEKREKRKNKVKKFNPKAVDGENFDFGTFFTVNEMIEIISITHRNKKLEDKKTIYNKYCKKYGDLLVDAYINRVTRSLEF